MVISEACGLNAVDLFDGTATLLPLQSGARELPLLDRESAEAILEHRGVLGEAPDSISLMQQGVATNGNRVTVTTVDGDRRGGWKALSPMASRSRIAPAWPRRPRCLLGARLLGVSFAEIDGRLVVWDVDPVPGFRAALPIEAFTVESALASLTESLLTAMSMTALSITMR